MLYGYLIIISSLLILIGYATGRRVGIKEGTKKGMALNSITFKLEGYYNDICPLCKRNHVD